jgi:hypothetical protein
MSDPLTIPDARSKSSQLPSGVFWAVALVVVAGMICATYLISRIVNVADKVADAPSQFALAPERLVEGIGRAFRSNVNVTTTLDTAIASVRNQANLVVLTSSINVTVTRSSEKSTLYGMINMGTTTVSVRAQDNRIQYIVPLDSFSPSDLRYDSTSKTLTVMIPPPRLDEQLVEVQSDPGKISVQTEVGWARMDAYSGKFSRDQAFHDLRPAVIQQGRHPLLADKARVNAQEAMLRLLSPLTASLREDVRVEVKFKE